MKHFIKQMMIECKFFYRIFIFVVYRINIYIKLEKKNRSKRVEKSKNNEIKAYWSKFGIKLSTRWHRWYYSINGCWDVRYIPEDLFYSYIEPFYNKLEFARAYADKNFYSQKFPDVKQPKTIIKRIDGIFYDGSLAYLTDNQVIEQFSAKEFIIKPTIDSGGGKGVCFFSAEHIRNSDNLLKEIKKHGSNFIVQEIIEQHPTLCRLNPSSLNTVRVMSLFQQDCVHILSAHIRIGEEKEKHDHYGYVSGICEDGFLKPFSRMTKTGKIIEKHPLGYSFSEICIPSMEQIYSIIKEKHREIPHFRLISWDFALDKCADPVLIEINLHWQGLNNHQLTNGPIFGNMTETVLSEVWEN